jgi:hypothetical protein
MRDDEISTDTVLSTQVSQYDSLFSLAFSPVHTSKSKQNQAHSVRKLFERIVTENRREKRETEKNFFGNRQAFDGHLTYTPSTNHSM